MPNKIPNSQISLRDQFAIATIAGLVASGQRDAKTILAVSKRLVGELISESLLTTLHNVDWSKAPKWATAHATDEDGRAHWYEVAPELNHTEWLISDDASRMAKAPNFSFQGDWTQSLRLRGES